MKHLFLIKPKSIFYICLAGFFVFWFPLPVFGAVMEVTVTITSMKIPQRAGAALAPDRPNTEFRINNMRITVVNRDDDVVARSWFNIQAGTEATVYFPYDNTKTPYHIYLEHRAYGPANGYGLPEGEEGVIMCRADCSNVVDAPGVVADEWFYLGGVEYSSCQPSYDPSCHASCPYPACSASYDPVFVNLDGLAVDPVNVIWSPYDDDYVWRSPVLFTID